MPTRYLKPGVCDSDTMENIKLSASEVFYYRLLTVVDDYGRMDARPLLLKSKCFPIKVSATEKTVSAWLQDLNEAGAILLYEVNGKPFLQITKWDNKPRSNESKYPNPTDAHKCMQSVGNREQSHTVLPVTVTVTETETETEGLASSDKSLSAAGPVKNGFCYIPLADKSEFAVPTELVIELETAYPAVDVPATLKEIRAWCLTNPNRCKTKRGAPAFLNRWLQKVQDRGR